MSNDITITSGSSGSGNGGNGGNGGVILVVSRDVLERCALHCCTKDRKHAVRVYDSLCEHITEYNEFNKQTGKKRHTVEMLEVPFDYSSDLGFTCFTGYNQPKEKGVRVMLNNVKHDDSADARRGIKTRGAYFTPIQISDELCAFLDLPLKSVMSRNDVTRYLNSYIKRYQLHDQANPRLILPDSRLKRLIDSGDPPSENSILGDDRISVFDLHRKFMARHFLPYT